MATIRKHGNKWQVQVRRAGSPPVSRSFTLKADADVWARQMEIQADKRAIPADARMLDRTTVLDLMQRYQDTVIPQKRCAKIEADMMAAMMKCSWSRLTLSAVSAATFNTYRDDRLKTVKPSTVCREFSILQHMFNLAIRDWGVPLQSNPFANVRRPRITGARERRVEGQEEMARLLAAAEKCNNHYIYPIMLFAIETGMRRSEILRVRWSDFDAKKRLLRIPVAKNGHPRTIPLSSLAVAVLEAMPREEAQPFPVTANALRLAWGRLADRANVKDLRFHDLRHEAVSRLFERGLATQEVALVSGHRDMRMLHRYTHLRPETVGAKLG